ncbi:MAG: fibronectin type III domain-containing protein [Candidatus Heimdallarchaeaceae archaeon]
MNKSIKTILILSIAIFSAGLLFVPLAQAQNLEVVFEETPSLFSEANFLPGGSVTRWVEITNNSGETKPIAVEAINYPGFPDSSSVPIDDLSRALLIVIREQGGSDLYGGSIGEKTLFNFYEDGNIYLSDITTGNLKIYDFEITFPSTKENEWQEKTTGFDILIGFQGEEGNGDDDGDNGDGGGGGGFLPPGLTILEESVRVASCCETSVTISWTTSYFSTSQVMYSPEGEDHTLDLTDNIGDPPTYGYSYTTAEYNISPKVTAHSVEITGLTPETTYYFRCASHASDPSISWQYSFVTPKIGTCSSIPEEETDGDEEGPLVWTGPGGTIPPTGGVIPIVEGVTTEEKGEPIAIFLPEVSSNLLADIGSIFGGLGNTCYPCFPWWIILILAIYPLMESTLDQRKDKRKAKKWFILSLGLIVLAIIFYLTNYYCVAIWVYSTLALSILLFWRFIDPKGTKYSFIVGLLILLILFIIWLILKCLYIWIILIAILIYLFIVDFLRKRRE